MSDGSKIVAAILAMCVVIVLGAWLSCLIGTSIWNEMIVDRFEWMTEHITKWDFFKLEIMADSLLWLSFISRGGNNSKSKN